MPYRNYETNYTKQCCGSVTFWHGSGSADRCIRITETDSDPDLDPTPSPAPDTTIFVNDLQDGN
jgi:hypothetical protein